MMVLPGLDGRLAGRMQSDGGLELIFQGGQTCRQGRAPIRLKTPHRLLQGAAESAAAAIVAAGWSCWAAPGEEPHGPSRLQLGCVCVSVYVGGGSAFVALLASRQTMQMQVSVYAADLPQWGGGERRVRIVC